jgi:dihydropteroate synthase
MSSAAESNAFSRNYSLNINGRLLDLSTPKVMGILNITPDSFYAGSRYRDETEIIESAQKMIESGAAILDVGGYSTRPGAADISQEEERARVVKAIQAVRENVPGAIISCDTFRSSVAQAAIDAGAEIINDVSGGTLDQNMFQTVAKLKVPYIVMHMRGTPETMHTMTHYENLPLEVISSLRDRVTQLAAAGIKDIIVDPGFGFAKNAVQNFQLLKHLELFQILERPLLAGLSRKSLIWRTLAITPDQALNGTSVLNTIALMKGVSILRVHDVAEAVQAVKLYNAYKNSA